MNTDQNISTNDPFDPAKLRLSQTFTEGAGVTKKITIVRVGKPDKQQFFQVHPDENYCMSVALLELKEQGDTFLVQPSLASEVPSEVVAKVLLTCITKQGVIFLWPIKLPESDGKLDMWNQSALNAVPIAKKHWIRLKSNRAAGAYDVLQAQDGWDKPEWPDMSYPDILKLAFNGKIIDSLDHPVIHQLQGRS